MSENSGGAGVRPRVEALLLGIVVRDLPDGAGVEMAFDNVDPGRCRTAVAPQPAGPAPLLRPPYWAAAKAPSFVAVGTCPIHAALALVVVRVRVSTPLPAPSLYSWTLDLSYSLGLAFPEETEDSDCVTYGEGNTVEVCLDVGETCTVALVAEENMGAYELKYTVTRDEDEEDRVVHMPPSTPPADEASAAGQPADEASAGAQPVVLPADDSQSVASASEGASRQATWAEQTDVDVAEQQDGTDGGLLRTETAVLREELAQLEAEEVAMEAEDVAMEADEAHTGDSNSEAQAGADDELQRADSALLRQELAQLEAQEAALESEEAGRAPAKVQEANAGAGERAADKADESEADEMHGTGEVAQEAFAKQEAKAEAEALGAQSALGPNGFALQPDTVPCKDSTGEGSGATGEGDCDRVEANQGEEGNAGSAGEDASDCLDQEQGGTGDGGAPGLDRKDTAALRDELAQLEGGQLPGHGADCDAGGDQPEPDSGDSGGESGSSTGGSNGSSPGGGGDSIDADGMNPEAAQNTMTEAEAGVGAEKASSSGASATSPDSEQPGMVPEAGADKPSQLAAGPADKVGEGATEDSRAPTLSADAGAAEGEQGLDFSETTLKAEAGNGGAEQDPAGRQDTWAEPAANTMSDGTGPTDAAKAQDGMVALHADAGSGLGPGEDSAEAGQAAAVGHDLVMSDSSPNNTTASKPPQCGAVPESEANEVALAAKAILEADENPALCRPSKPKYRPPDSDKALPKGATPQGALIGCDDLMPQAEHEPPASTTSSLGPGDGNAPSVGILADSSRTASEDSAPRAGAPDGDTLSSAAEDAPTAVSEIKLKEEEPQAPQADTVCVDVVMVDVDPPAPSAAEVVAEALLELEKMESAPSSQGSERSGDSVDNWLKQARQQPAYPDHHPVPAFSRYLLEMTPVLHSIGISASPPVLPISALAPHQADHRSAPPQHSSLPAQSFLPQLQAPPGNEPLDDASHSRC
eukprot:gene12067-2200_t